MMRILTSLLSLFLAMGTLGGCMARAKVRVAENGSTAAPKVAAEDDQKNAAVKGEGPAQGSVDTAQRARTINDEQERHDGD
jgi:hypothetical protein